MWFGMDYSPMSFIVHVDTCLMIQAASIALLRNLLVNTGRKNQDSEGGIIMELHSDFNFIGKEKFLVVADLSSHNVWSVVDVPQL